MKDIFIVKDKKINQVPTYYFSIDLDRIINRYIPTYLILKVVLTSRILISRKQQIVQGIVISVELKAQITPIQHRYSRGQSGIVEIKNNSQLGRRARGTSTQTSITLLTPPVKTSKHENHKTRRSQASNRKIQTIIIQLPDLPANLNLLRTPHVSHKMKSHYRAVHARKKNTRRIYRRHPFGESGRSLEPRPPRAALARPPCLAWRSFIWPSSSAAWRGGKAAGLRSVRVKISRVLECRCSASDRGVFVQCRVRGVEVAGFLAAGRGAHAPFHQHHIGKSQCLVSIK